MVGEHVLSRERVQRRAARVVVTHGQAAGVGPGGILVVLAAVDLHLMLIEPMIQIPCHGHRRQADSGLRRERGFDRKRGVRQSRTHRLSDDRLVARCGDPTPGLRQARQRGPIAISLRNVSRQRLPRSVDDLAESARTREIAIEIVERAILGVDHDDRRDLRAQGARDRVRRRNLGSVRARGAGHTRADAEQRRRHEVSQGGRRGKPKSGERAHTRDYRRCAAVQATAGVRAVPAT